MARKPEREHDGVSRQDSGDYVSALTTTDFERLEVDDRKSNRRSVTILQEHHRIRCRGLNASDRPK
jgi:hypothetical protein